MAESSKPLSEIIKPQSADDPVCQPDIAFAFANVSIGADCNKTSLLLFRLPNSRAADLFARLGELNMNLPDNANSPKNTGNAADDDNPALSLSMRGPNGERFVPPEPLGSALATALGAADLKTEPVDTFVEFTEDCLLFCMLRFGLETAQSAADPQETARMLQAPLEELIGASADLVYAGSETLEAQTYAELRAWACRSSLMRIQQAQLCAAATPGEPKSAKPSL